MRASDHTEPEATNSEGTDAQCVLVKSLMELARDYVIVGIKGKLLRVRRKSDDAELWLSVSFKG